MLISIIALINSFWSTPQVEIKNPAKFHQTSPKIYLRSFRQNRWGKSREILAKRNSKPWDGHFSAKNFRQNKADKLYLKQIKEDLKTSIVALPKWHTQALQDLEVRKDKNVSRGLSSSKKMILHTDSIQNSRELIAVFIHEMGHITDLGALKGRRGHKTNFYDGQTPILNDDLSFIFYKISWQNSYTKKKSAQRRDFVSGYAMSDCFEDFAETYLFYKLHGEKFRGILHNSPDLKRKYEFMKKYVFNGQEFQLNKFPNPNFNYQKVFDTTLLSFNEKDL